jgi:hypothetical protein
LRFFLLFFSASFAGRTTTVEGEEDKEFFLADCSRVVSLTLA